MTIALVAGVAAGLNIWLAPHLVGHVPLDPTTRLAWLADSIELRFPHVVATVSVGDLVLFAGVIAFIVTAMRRETTESPPAVLQTAAPNA